MAGGRPTSRMKADFHLLSAGPCYYESMIWWLIKKLRGRVIEVQGSPGDGAADSFDPFPEPVVIEFRDVLDLHSIPPRQVRAVVEDYLEEAHRTRTQWVRIVHGKGKGVQREIIRSILSEKPYVVDFRDAPPEAGGWGATVVTLSDEDEPQAS